MEQQQSQPSSQETPGETGGSTLLTDGVGTPQGNQLDTPQEAPANPAPDPSARPEWFPEKWWKEGKPDHEGLAKSYVNLEKLLGSEKVPVPKSEDDAEGWDRYFKAAGKPADAKEYAFEIEKDSLPENFYDDTAEQAFRDWAHQNHLTKTQAKNLHKAYVKTQLDRHKAWEDQQKQTKARLQTDLMREHGAAYEGFLQSAKGAMARYADPDFVKMLDESGLGNDPRMIRAFGRIGKAMHGETRLNGQPRPEVNSGDIEAAISKYRDDHKAALNDRAHPQHELHVQNLQKLYAKRFPEQQ